VPRSLEDQAEELARHIARDGLPPDAGAIAKLRGLVSAARQHGWDAATAEAREQVREWAEQF
jgi:enoyl-CoA hydratase/carnithine racemase